MALGGCDQRRGLSDKILNLTILLDSRNTNEININNLDSVNN